MLAKHADMTEGSASSIRRMRTTGRLRAVIECPDNDARVRASAPQRRTIMSHPRPGHLGPAGCVALCVPARSHGARAMVVEFRKDMKVPAGGLALLSKDSINKLPSGNPAFEEWKKQIGSPPCDRRIRRPSLVDVGREPIDALGDDAVIKLARKAARGIHVASPVFDGASEEEIFKLLAKAVLLPGASARGV